MKRQKADKVYNTFQEYKNSEELAELFEPYAQSELDRHLRFAKDGFIRAFAVKDENAVYGFKLYRHFERHGHKHLKETTTGAMISAQSMKVVNVYESGFEITEERIEKTEENRAWLRKTDRDITVM